MIEKVYAVLYEIRPENDFKSSKNFIKDQLLDSLDIVLLISELEGMFNIQIDALDIVPENFDSVESICGLIKKSDELQF